MDEDYQKYLDLLHKSSVSDELIDDLIDKITGQRIKLKSRVIGGEINEVYRIELVNNLRYILRIAHKDKSEFLVESWAMKQVEQVGVKVPEVVMIDNLEIEGGLYSYCLMEEIIGDTMERGTLEWHTLDVYQQKNWLYKSGEVLSLIHSVNTKGWGPYLEEGKSEYETAGELLDEYLDKRLKYLEIAQEIGAEVWVDKMISVLHANAELLTNGVSCLNHGDFGPKHIIIAGDSISGIIDWGLVRSDVRFADIANWDYWFDDYPVKWLLEGYQDKTIFDDDFDIKIHLLRMIKGIDVIEWYWGQKYEKGVSDAVVKLKKDVEFFD